MTSEAGLTGLRIIASQAICYPGKGAPAIEAADVHGRVESFEVSVQDYGYGNEAYEIEVNFRDDAGAFWQADLNNIRAD